MQVNECVGYLEFVYTVYGFIYLVFIHILGNKAFGVEHYSTYLSELHIDGKYFWGLFPHTCLTPEQSD